MDEAQSEPVSELEPISIEFPVLLELQRALIQRDSTMHTRFVRAPLFDRNLVRLVRHSLVPRKVGMRQIKAISHMTVNGEYLFAAENNGIYRFHANGPVVDSGTLVANFGTDIFWFEVLDATRFLVLDFSRGLSLVDGPLEIQQVQKVADPFLPDAAVWATVCCYRRELSALFVASAGRWFSVSIPDGAVCEYKVELNTWPKDLVDRGARKQPGAGAIYPFFSSTVPTGICFLVRHYDSTVSASWIHKHNNTVACYRLPYTIPAEARLAVYDGGGFCFSKSTNEVLVAREEQKIRTVGDFVFPSFYPLNDSRITNLVIDADRGILFVQIGRQTIYAIEIGRPVVRDSKAGLVLHDTLF